MTRIDELQKKYSTIPRDVIVQWEVHGRGVRDTDDLDKASDWRPAIGTYQNKFDDVSLKEMVGKRPSRMKDGRMLRPSGFYMKTGAGCGLRINPKSPYEIREAGGRFSLCEGEEKVEAYKIHSSEVRLLEGRFELGGFVNAEHEERIHVSFVERVATAASYKPNFTIHTEAMPRKGMQRLKDAGLDCLTIQLEVWDPQLFGVVLPGKARHTPYEGWLESVTDAVDVFGAGNVAVKTLGGLTLIPENGHKTWQEARDTHIEHVHWATKSGAIPCIGPLSLPAGSVYGEDPSLREKLAPTEYYLDVFLAHHEAMKEHGLYQKLNKFMYCGECCSGALYLGDLGILEQAGDWGNWMADLVPEKANWILQFIRSVTPTAPALPSDGAAGGQ